MATWHYGVALLAFLLGQSGCKNEITPPSSVGSPAWKAVTQFQSLDFRYLINHNGVLYLDAINPAVNSVRDSSGNWYYPGERGLVYRTSDAISWEKIKSFAHDIGPLTFHGDTLYCLASDSIFRFTPNGIWQGAYVTPPPLGNPSADGDMIFLRDTLYSMQTFFTNSAQTFRIHTDGTYEEVAGPDGMAHFSGAKFIHAVVGGREVAYVRPRWGASMFLVFDGQNYTHVENGLSAGQLIAPTDAMIVINDTLYAGFGGQQGSGTPGCIKVLTNNQWVSRYDTLLSSHSAYVVNPTLYAQPTALAFWNGSLYVATNSQGVEKWTDTIGWIRISSGLIPGNVAGLLEPDLRAPIPFLESIGNKLVVAYGKPGYAPWGSTGVYTMGIP